MVCEHYFVDEAGMQPSPSYYPERFFRLGICINEDCRTDICVDNYVDSGEEFEGKRLLFSPGLNTLLEDVFVSN